MGAKPSRSQERGQNRCGHSSAGGAAKRIGKVFKPKFGVEMELMTARGPQNASRIAAEYNAGVRYFDVFIGGSGTFESLVDAGMVEPLDGLLILPEVKDAKNWWGGHIWEDNISTNRFLYSFIADAGTGGFWYNTEVVKPEELRPWTTF
jgi:ABC-type Fe3+ transport system substrate-binding protein